MRKLRIWNGRGDYRDFDGHFYVCAPTKKMAVELLKEAGHCWMNMREFTRYYSECWGNAMATMTPEIGVWFVDKKNHLKDNFVPRRLI